MLTIISDMPTQIINHLPETGSLDVIIFEIELFERSRDYEQRIKSAIQQAEEGIPIIILCDKEYSQYELWGNLVAMPNVYVCKKSELDKLAAIVEKIR